MRRFMDRDFLLSTDTAQKLYHDAAAKEPIFDYHCHLVPQEIAENRRFENMNEVWLGADHYKWRVMRANGVAEEFITGSADPYEKFLAWARTVPLLIGNPLYHWTHLELQRYFDIDEPFSEKNAGDVWKHCNDKLQNDANLSVYGIFKKFNVYAVGTTDDPVDTLEFHKKIVKDGKTDTKVLPSFRPDNALDIEKDGWKDYVQDLGSATGVTIVKFDDFLRALEVSLDHFAKNGCKISDHGLSDPPFEPASDGSTGASWDKEAGAVFVKRFSGGTVTPRETELFKSRVLCGLAREYAKRGWAMQLHLFPLRGINTGKTASLGVNKGFDVIDDGVMSRKLALLLDAVESRGGLPKTILYSLNPKDFYPLATIGGSFQGEVPGKIQLGSAWWFLDNKDQMEAQMRVYANIGVLPRFVGMLTDSRSFLSYSRHEYFRRILCALIGSWAEAGEIPNDVQLLSGFVRDISFRNAKAYFA